MSDVKDYKISETEAERVLLKNFNDRPNALASYGIAKKTGEQTKDIFDRQFQLMKEKHNLLAEKTDEVENTSKEAKRESAAAKAESEAAKAESAEAKATADSVRADADSGKFQGEKGDPGEKGETGDRGYSGVHIGSEEPDYDANVWVNPSGDPTSTEDWEFDLENGGTDTKTVVVVGSDEATANGQLGILKVRQADGSWKEIPAIVGPQGIQGVQGVQGEKGEKGDTGEGFKISKTYASVDEMNAGFASDGVPLYGFVLIDTGNVEDADNAKLYVKQEDGYHYLTDLSGSQGIKGEKGNKGDRGDAFTYEDFTEAQLLALKGERGDVGPQGIQGPTGAQGVQGETGSQGIQGIQGVQGEKGDKGDKGEKGESGVTTPINSFFTLSVDSEGNLYVYTSEDGSAPEFEYDEATGNLYFVTEEG